MRVCMSHGDLRMCVIDKPLEPTTQSLMDTLKVTKDLSTMYTLAKKGYMRKLLLQTQEDVKKICFGSDVCLPVSGNMKTHFNDLVKAKQFTIQVLNDAAFSQMNETQLASLKTDKTARQNFILQHIFLGIMQHGDEENNSRLIAQSAQQGHPVSELLWSDGKPVISEADGSVYVVDRSIRIREGIVQVLRRIE